MTAKAVEKFTDDELENRILALRAQREADFTAELGKLLEEYRVELIPVATITPSGTEMGLQVKAK